MLIKGLSPSAKAGLYAMAMSFCLPVRLFVCLSLTAAGGGGLSHRPFRPNWLVWRHFVGVSVETATHKYFKFVIPDFNNISTGSFKHFVVSVLRSFSCLRVMHDSLYVRLGWRCIVIFFLFTNPISALMFLVWRQKRSKNMFHQSAKICTLGIPGRVWTNSMLMCH